MNADDLDRPILITGGCGFIGCNLADALAKRGTPIVAFDNLSRAGVRENAQWLKSRHGDLVSIVTGDIRDAISVIEAVRGAEAVLHLAAQVAVTGSLQDPVDDFEINARGTLNVLEAIRVHNHSAPMIFRLDQQGLWPAGAGQRHPPDRKTSRSQRSSLRRLASAKMLRWISIVHTDAPRARPISMCAITRAFTA